MMLGWLKRRKMKRDEIAELYDFVAEMETVLENVDLLLSLEDEEVELGISMIDLLRPEYVHAPGWSGGPGFNVPMQNRLNLLQPFPMPTPEVFTTPPVSDPRLHRAIHLRSDVMISDQELMIRRSPGDMGALIARVGKQIEAQIAEYLLRIAGDSMERARLLNAVHKTRS